MVEMLSRRVRGLMWGVNASVRGGVRRVAASAAVGMMSVVGGCLPSPMKLEQRLDGEIKTTLKLEGPVQIQMQMQGPTIKYDGTFISERLFDRVNVNETRTDWILAVLGEPSSRAELDNGTTIWKWSYRPLEQEASLFSVFGGGSKDEPKLQTSTTFLRIDRGGLVLEKWRD